MSSRLPGTDFRWSPRGVADALYVGVGQGDEGYAGLMSSLQNLIPDTQAQNIWVPRPASTSIQAFGALTTPGAISALLVVGNYAYGMIASGRTAGKDEPFSVNLLTGALVTITGITAGNVPTTQASPTTSMCVVGVKVVVCHSGFDGVTNFVGWIDVSNPAAPVWSAGNTATNALPSVPVAVAQFNGRAYYLCNPAGTTPAALLSDSLDATTRTNGTYVLTFNDTQPLVTAAGMGLQNLSGGVVQSLMVFKQNVIYQVTGDPTSSLSVNSLNAAVGTSSPRSVCATPLGLAFAANDGLRYIDLQGNISDPIGIAGQGVVSPFVNVSSPATTCAACNSTVIRISVSNGGVANTPRQEFWLDLQRRVWSGPHTFPASYIQPWGATFIMAGWSINANLWQSDSHVSSTSTYTENGAAMNFVYETSFLPDSGQQGMHNIIESTLWAAFHDQTTRISVTAFDTKGTPLGNCLISDPTVQAGGIWGTGSWGSMIWGTGLSPISPRQLKWPLPLTFTRMQLQATGVSASGVKLGDFFARLQVLDYQPNE